MRRVEIIQVFTIFLLLSVIVACVGEARQEPTLPATSVVMTATDTAVPPAPTAEPTTEGPTELPTATPRPTAIPSPTATPIPTPRPLDEGECIAWYEAPSFLDREVCLEGRVNFIRSANPARTLFFLVLDPSVPDIDHCCGLLYGWLYASKVYDTIPVGGMSELFEGECVRLHGTIEKGEGPQYLVPIKTQEQIEIIECSECQIPEACGL